MTKVARKEHTSQKMEFSFKNIVILVTGGSNGIGASFIKFALGEGVKNILILDIDERNGVILQNDSNQKYGPGKVKFVKCDVSNSEELEQQFAAALKDKTNTYAVVNSAGILDGSFDVCKEMIDINLTGTVTGTFKALDLMRKDKGGKGGAIINISSTIVLYPSPHTPVYNATKAAVLMFSNCLGMDEYYSKTGVRILTICLGPTDTDLYNFSKIITFDDYIQDQPAKGVGRKPGQSVESAGRAMIEMFKRGASGSTWVSNADRPVEDVTEVVKKASGILSQTVRNIEAK